MLGEGFSGGPHSIGSTLLAKELAHAPESGLFDDLRQSARGEVTRMTGDAEGVPVSRTPLLVASLARARPSQHRRCAAAWSGLDAEGTGSASVNAAPAVNPDGRDSSHDSYCGPDPRTHGGRRSRYVDAWLARASVIPYDCSSANRARSIENRALCASSTPSRYPGGLSRTCASSARINAVRKGGVLLKAELTRCNACALARPSSTHSSDP